MCARRRAAARKLHFSLAHGNAGPNRRSDFSAPIFGAKACGALDTDLQTELQEDYDTAQRCEFPPAQTGRGLAPLPAAVL